MILLYRCYNEIEKRSKRRREEGSPLKVKRSTVIVMDDELVILLGSDFDLKEEGRPKLKGMCLFVEETSVELDMRDCFGSSEEEVSYRDVEGTSTHPINREKTVHGEGRR